MRRSLLLPAIIIALLCAAAPVLAAQVSLLLPLGRTDYQTNERIDISAVRSDVAALPAGTLQMSVTGADGSVLSFSFPARAVALENGKASTTEHLHLNGWLLRPGTYTVAVAVDGATAQTTIGVYSHVRQSTYRLLHWGGDYSKQDELIAQGKDGMGFNLIYDGNVLNQQASIRAGVDIMGNCLMGGGHQHDLRLQNDWSDPYVYLGAVQRGVDRAFAFRTMPNAIGAHLHDEPGLTWAVHPFMKDKDGKPVMNDHDIKQQREAYVRAYGEEPIWANEFDAKDPAKLAAWVKMNDFKLGFMDAFWKSSEQALRRFKPGYLAVTQSQYGWSALYDGYYFNVARSMPVISGHGGYNDFWLRNFNPSLFLEMALPRQLDKPTWYLPEWYGMTNNSFREEHNLSFITGIQGMATPPGLDSRSECASGITESNKLFARLGTIFAKPAYTRQDVTLLYSKSAAYYSLGSTQMGDIPVIYMATKLLQYPISVVLDEDVIDGTLAANHKAIIVAGVDYLEPAVVANLEGFAKAGGLVLVTNDVKVAIAGAVKLNVTPSEKSTKAYDAVKALPANSDQAKAAMSKANSFRAWLEYSAPTAAALKTALVKAGIQPVIESSIDTIAVGKQTRGEIEYRFAVNYTPEAGYSEAAHGYGVPVAAKATLTMADDGRPVYDAVRGGIVPEFAAKKKTLTGSFQFGPGQMRAFAVTARPIGSVAVGTPSLNRDLTRDTEPVRLEFAATLLDDKAGVLAGTAPLQVQVVDPLGVVRYDLFRATDAGVCSLSLPLAANDPAGTWTVTVKELLSLKEGKAAFTYAPAAACGVAAGASARAFYYPADKANIYDFFRNHRQITIVKGSSPYCDAAAERLAAAFLPYNVKATIMTAAEANKPRPLSDIEAATWCGTGANGGVVTKGNVKPGTDNSPTLVGYNLPGPTVLLGNAADNPLIKWMEQNNVLPYKVTATFPGTGRGLLAWNLMALGHDIESVACIANDAVGLNEAVGTLYALGIGMDPVTPLVLPTANSIIPAGKVVAPPALALQWQAVLPDRVTAITPDGDGVEAATVNGVIVAFDAKGKAGKSKAGDAPAAGKPALDVSKLPKDKLVGGLKMKQTLVNGDLTALAYIGGCLQVFDAAGTLKGQVQLPTDITAVAWTGTNLAVGLSDGTLSVFAVK
jgi:hypothetical protein